MTRYNLSPGVDVRPIMDMTGGDPEYNEVFLTDVRVPATRMLGREGDGWQIVMEQLPRNVRDGQSWS